MARQKPRAPAKSRASENFYKGYGLAQEHPLFGPLLVRATVVRNEDGPYPREGWARVAADGTIYVHPNRVAEPEE